MAGLNDALAYREPHAPALSSLGTGDLRWLLDDFIAEGGTARVYRARHIAGGPIRAAKVLKGRFVGNRNVQALFAREAEILSSVDNQHVPQLLDHSSSTAQPYTVMELILGRPLSAYTAWRHQLPLAWTLGVLIEVAEGLSAVHAAGWVHGDIKPANIIVRRHQADERAYLIDFGVAAALGETADQLAGTPQFFAPENVQGAPRAPASDLYSLGVVAFQCLTGRLPYSSGSVVNVLRQQVEAPVPNPRNINPNLPTEVDTILRRLLDKQPEHRGTARTLITELTALYATFQNNAIPLHRPDDSTRRTAPAWPTAPSSFVDIRTTVPSLRST